LNYELLQQILANSCDFELKNDFQTLY